MLKMVTLSNVKNAVGVQFLRRFVLLESMKWKFEQHLEMPLEFNNICMFYFCVAFYMFCMNSYSYRHNMFYVLSTFSVAHINIKEHFSIMWNLSKTSKYNF